MNPKSFYKKGKIVIGLGFGDEGKGNFTSYLCSNSKNPIVVRFSGGQQAGHTVMFNGVKHIFSNFGSGSLQNIPTYFTEHTCLYINNIDIEKNILEKLGFSPVLYVHPKAKITTPYDIIYGRIIEKINRFGSCGLGVGSTMYRYDYTTYKLYAIDFLYEHILIEKLNKINEYYRNKATENGFLDEYLRMVNEEGGICEQYYGLISKKLFLPYYLINCNTSLFNLSFLVSNVFTLLIELANLV